ncbi:CLIP domain-containing serine protease [Halocaridina rubra]|uniref:limulus clotting factor C n=1 Tax=Halocaridina rubra TaxID=373956 RepID=A0AAN8WVA2_HALRR
MKRRECFITIIILWCVIFHSFVDAFEDGARERRGLGFLRNRLRQGGIADVKPVEQPLPHFGTNATKYMRVGDSSGAFGSSSQSSIFGAQECDTTYVMEGGQSVALYSRHDRYSYSCKQTFKSVNADATKLSLTCYDFSLKFNCFFESLTVTADGSKMVYCRNNKVPNMNATEIIVEYKRNLLGFFGGYVCVIMAEFTASTRDAEGAAEGDDDEMSCGVTAAMEAEKENDNTRVVGGKNAEMGAHPWMTYLKMYVGSYMYEYRCGGSLISKSHILTAAHCLFGYDIRKIDVYLGKHDVSNLNEPGQAMFTTLDYVTHEAYDDYLVINDIAIVYLGQEVEYSHSIRPICLPTADFTLTNNKVTATGWGAVSYGGFEATILQEVGLTVQDNSECERDWQIKFSDNTFAIFDNQMCAKDRGKDTCSGDSGGPLSHMDADRWMLVGLTSYGYKCADPDVGGVYTRVSEYIDWINAKMAINP